MNTVVIDFETHWSSKDYTLSKMGPIEYIRDPRFHVQLMGVSIDGDPPVVLEGGDIAAFARGVNWGNVLLVGHNLNGFDALVLSEHYGVRPRWMLDTMVMSRWAGHSRLCGDSHAALTDWLNNGVKKPGTVVSDGKRWPDDFTEEERRFFRQYCADDVAQCAANFRAMFPLMTDEVVRFASLTARMGTEPALVLDEGMTRTYLAELEAATAKAREDIAHMFKFANDEEFLTAIRSSPKFASMLRKLGVVPPMKVSETRTETARRKLQERADAGDAEAIRSLADRDYVVMGFAFSKNDLEFTALRDHEDPRVRLLVETRLLNNSSILKSRAERLLAVASGGRTLPVLLNVFKAHTSRYTAGNSEGSSDGLNFQNFNKRDPKQLTLRRAIRPAPGHSLVACDSSQIEARMLAWEANEHDLISAFREGRDPYAELAGRIFGRDPLELKRCVNAGDKTAKMQRTVAKTAILSAGYGTSAKKYSDTLLRSGVKLARSMDGHFEKAREAHSAYRASNAHIVSFWRTCGDVLHALVSGNSGQFGGADGTMFRYGHEDVGKEEAVPTVWLPGGYALRYPGLRTQMGDDGRLEYRYDKRQGKGIVHARIYGASLTENITQGLSFQLLMWQANRMDEQGVRLVCNIHDAWIAVAEDHEAEAVRDIMERAMSSVPDWLAGFPVACEAEIGGDFTIA